LLFISDGLAVLLSGAQDTQAKLYWGVDIAAFQNELKLNIDDISERFNTGHIFNNSYSHIDDCGLYPYVS